MAITTKDVAKIANLARIALPETEREAVAAELSTILQWIDQLQEVPTEGVPQMFGHSGVTLPLRADKVTDGNVQDKVLANAPLAEYGCFAVPKVIE